MGPSVKYIYASLETSVKERMNSTEEKWYLVYTKISRSKSFNVKL